MSAKAESGGLWKLGLALTLLLVPFSSWVHQQLNGKLGADSVAGSEAKVMDPAPTFTLEQLRLYDGKPESGGVSNLLVAIWGRVFNVTTGEEFYGPGRGYAIFAGQDITRAIALTKIKTSMVNRDLEGLEPKKLRHLNNTYWNTYVYKYPIVGMLVDPPYDPQAYDEYAGSFAELSRGLPEPEPGSLAAAALSQAAGEPKEKKPAVKQSKCPMFRAARAVRDALAEYVPKLLLGS
eukprot:TRINITY_DN12380_c0_g1_i1.p1 TRINITY_DN12380_c0_g1~~TRINITY_DN12380_c0_g1_i1.p1  ORF type:complete len:254 (-),score=38.60 TRINITY_DN12380_c0_g1_i1:415-1119(-)